MRNVVDHNYCVRHKEHDFVWVSTKNMWQKTFDNKHYHVYANCILGKNAQFNPRHVEVKLQHTITSAVSQTLKDRLAF